MTREIAIALCLGVMCLMLLVLLVRQQQISKRARAQVESLKAGIRSREDELRYLISDRLPALTESLLVQSRAVPGLRDQQLLGTPFADSAESVLRAFENMLVESRRKADHAVRDTLAGIIGKVQSLIGEQEIELRRMQDDHEHPDVLGDLFTLDHLNAQMARKTQAILVLCGKWVGRQRNVATLTEVVRGAITKIGDYTRVRYAENEEIAVTAQAVEAVVISLAEILENALNKSEPNAPVWVDILTAYNGVSITVSDAGIGMTDHQLASAGATLRGDRPVDITRLGDPPRIGFAAIAALSESYGFSAHLNGQSSSGGLSATVFVPTNLLTRPEKRDPRVIRQTAVLPPPPTSSATGLPQRTRATAISGPAVQQVGQQEPPRIDAQEAGSRLGAFQSGTRAGRRAGVSSPLSDSNDR
ncbi:ATP-binding protein [Streptomyces prunicolor]|uniref:ATP-binding protein n=1 Tax=Streptomyces prunicolor TaxID=67348 RepID=UPI000366A281|nr:ATP-binding protein [Streptomyces prunicolor]